LKLDIIESRDDLWSINLDDLGGVDDYPSQINRNLKDQNLCDGPSTTDTDPADMDTEITIAKLSEQEHTFYLLRGTITNDKSRVFLEYMTNNHAMLTATPDDMVTKLIGKDAAIKR
jgi:hypothetical protein